MAIDVVCARVSVWELIVMPSIPPKNNSISNGEHK